MVVGEGGVAWKRATVQNLIRPHTALQNVFLQVAFKRVLSASVEF